MLDASTWMSAAVNSSGTRLQAEEGGRDEASVFPIGGVPCGDRETRKRAGEGGSEG